MIANIVGWVFLISAWTVPTFIKDKQDKHLWGLILSAAAFGVFVGAALKFFFI